MGGIHFVLANWKNQIKQTNFQSNMSGALLLLLVLLPLMKQNLIRLFFFLIAKIRSRKEILNPTSGSSSSSSASVMAPPPTKYDVFLSFRGVDTRNTIISHLYAGLKGKQINAFKDDISLEKGNEISPELIKAIEESMIYIIVFSKNYASSSWCLDELVKIMGCKKKYGDQRHVIPIFYHVEPSVARYQTGTYSDAFLKHEQRIKDEVIRRWKDALTEAANLSGWELNAASQEAKFVDDIAKDILKKLDRSISCDSDNKGMVGIDEHIAQIKSLLQLESEAVRIIGIWGMGGIGKTTLARVLYEKLRNQFSSRCLVENAQQEIDRDGTYRLRQKYLSELGFSDKRLKRATVLLILDDVNISSQIQELIGGRGNFGQGSRIIVTSRDLQVLKNAEADRIYEVEEMNYQDSLELFSLYAFKQINPIETFKPLVENLLEYAKGVPLALKVLGSLLYGRTMEAWESELLKLKRLPDVEIFNVLKLSYDGLDEEQKDIFLDIACFYATRLNGEALDMLDGCGFCTDIGIDVLKDRGLVYISKDEIKMHDLILEMGIEIVRRQYPNNPGKRSRLWNHEEIYYVLTKNKGTDAIQCIYLNMREIKEVHLQSGIFKSMPNLRMLYFRINYWFQKVQSNVILPAFLESLPDGLKILYWDGFPLRSLPLDFISENLVKLYMLGSDLEQLWEKDQELPNLKRLDLSYSQNLIRIPDLSKFPNIEDILLSGCRSLIEVHSSSFLNKLKSLWLNDCDELTGLNVPSNILSRSSGLVELYNCHKLKTFSISRTSSEVVESCGRSHFNGCSGAKEIYDGGQRGYLDKLHSVRLHGPSRSSHEHCLLDLGSCKSLTSLSFDLCELKLLKRLCLRGCSNLKFFSEIAYTVENLAVLILDETAIQELPSSLHRLVGLQELCLQGCRRLEIIPYSIGRLTRLCKLDLTYCESLETFPSSIFKLKLTKLDLFCCSKLKTFPEILEPAESFTYIDLEGTEIKELPSSLDFLVGLQTLYLKRCRYLESLPNSICNLKLLSRLDCSECPILTEIPNDIGRLSSLRDLSLMGTGIVNLPESIAHLSSLESLNVSGTRIVNLPESIANLSNMESLDVYYTGIVILPKIIALLSSLKSLDFSRTGIAKIRSRKEIFNPMSESSSSLAATVMAPPPKYDLFLSIREEDTLKNFTSHVHDALRWIKVKAFIDNRSLETGNEISPELYKAIEESMIYVIVFSKDYASSRWCLDELVKIMECKKKYERVVIPIFYYVDPSTVRHQKKTYADAFVKHENRLVPKEVIQRWKDALTQAADLFGWDSNTARTEYKFVDDIAQYILKKLDRSISSDSDNKGTLGIDEHIAQIQTLMQLESEAVRIIGICGMGGIGKTTLARALYEKLRYQFSFRSLVENAQQKIDRDGTYSLRLKYLSELGFLDERLKRAKVLLILDDVKISSQVQELIGGRVNFSQGSRIIVTSRDLQVLKNVEADEIYEVKEMSYQDSLQLF